MPEQSSVDKLSKKLTGMIVVGLLFAACATGAFAATLYIVNRRATPIESRMDGYDSNWRQWRLWADVQSRLDRNILNRIEALEAKNGIHN